MRQADSHDAVLHDVRMARKAKPVDPEALNTAQSNVAALIAAEGLSVNAWASKYKLVQSSINRIVTGIQDPTAGYLQQIATVVSSKGRRRLEAWQLLAPNLGSSASAEPGASVAPADAELLAAFDALPRAERETLRRQIIERAEVFRAYLREVRGEPPAPTTASGLPVAFVERRHTPAPPPGAERRRGVTVYVHPQASDPDAFPPRRPRPATSKPPSKPSAR